MNTDPPLSDAEQDYIARCEAFAREVIAPNAAPCDRENAFAAEVHHAAHERGILNVAIPAELGGQGLSHRAMALGGLAMAEECAPLTFSLGFNHGSLRPVLRFGTTAQRERLVGELLARRGYASWCMTEPDSSGSDLLAIQTTARKVTGGFALSGTKCMTGNGTAASLYFVLARTFDGDVDLGLSIFAVPRDERVEVGPNTDKLGFRCLPTPTIQFHDAFAPDDHVIGDLGCAVSVLLDSLDYMRFGGGIVLLGLVRGALRDTLPFLHERRVYGGERLVDVSHVQIELGKVVAQLHALTPLLFSIGDDLERDRPCRERTATLKLLGSELAVHATSVAMQFMGWRGIDGSYPLQKRFRDARQTTIYEGTSELLAMGLFRNYLYTATPETRR